MTQSVVEPVRAGRGSNNDDPFWLIHLYRGGVEIGAIALCGWRKRTPKGHIRDIPPHQQVPCIVCAELKRGFR